MRALTDRHERACEGFTAVVDQAAGRWNRPSPCGWDAGAIVEHVIGFHDVLLLRPLDAKLKRPKDGHDERWRVTVPAILSALRGAGPDSPVSVPGSDQMDLERVLPALTTDVVVHTWDLARSLGVDPALDEALCKECLDTVIPNEERMRAGEMFASPLPVPDGAGVSTKLIAFCGRDPSWTPEG
ncbi:MAG: TIGR03086 family metal-binding protein [Acidimicrobiales bacterium]